MEIVVLDGAILNPGDVDWGPISEIGELRVHDETPPGKVAERAARADVLLTNKTPLKAKDIAGFERVKLVCVLATGYNVVDIEACAAKNIPVCNVVAYGVDDVAQHTLAMLLEICRHVTEHTESVKAGEWKKSHLWCYWKKTPVCLKGLTMGVIGFGSIGRRVGELAHAFGMSVLAHCPHPKNPPNYSPFSFASLEQLLTASDVISLHCPLTPQTQEIINSTSIAKMRDGVILLNTARGGLVNEAAAAKALKSGKLGALGTDVLSVEPPPASNPLLKAPNTVITPHIAWATNKARQNIITLTAENIHRWKQGTPVNVVNGVTVATPCR
ncbi:MAG: D-2-hydroxyacid dehydrogenase [Desulfovibrio sp.]|jgi:glycerate dehydrogenase|nr:D-2-hydroxyacid dehydrogenase [Desulfovibrio sp.]